MFETVASIASRGSLLVLARITLVLTAAAATVLWAFYPAISVFGGPRVSGAFAGSAALVHFAPDRWWAWLVAVLAAIFLIVFVWYATQQVKFAPQADPKRPWRTLTLSFGRVSFEDKTLNDNVRHARHAISIDENRAAFARAGATRTGRDRTGTPTDFAPSSRPGNVRQTRFILCYPSLDGMQHDERKVGFPVLTRWLLLTWQGKQRNIADPNAPLHDSVYKRFAVQGVVHYDAARPYRPEGLRLHARLPNYYKTIPVPPEERGVLGFIKSFFLTS